SRSTPPGADCGIAGLVNPLPSRAELASSFPPEAATSCSPDEASIRAWSGRCGRGLGFSAIGSDLPSTDHRRSGRRQAMRIGLIGVGNIGGTLARTFVRAGHEVVLSNSRGPESLSELTAELGGRAQ